MIAAPGADAGLADREEQGPDLQAADPRFAAPVVPGRSHRRREPHHAVIGEQVLREPAAEGRAVVALDDQWRSMLGKERGQDESRAGGFHVRDGKPSQLAAAGQVTHGEDRRVNAVDRRGA